MIAIIFAAVCLLNVVTLAHGTTSAPLFLIKNTTKAQCNLIEEECDNSFCCTEHFCCNYHEDDEVGKDHKDDGSSDDDLMHSEGCELCKDEKNCCPKKYCCNVKEDEKGGINWQWLNLLRIIPGIGIGGAYLAFYLYRRKQKKINESVNVANAVNAPNGQPPPYGAAYAESGGTIIMPGNLQAPPPRDNFGTAQGSYPRNM